MAEGKYGRLFTEEDVRHMMRWALRQGARAAVLEPVGLIEAFELEQSSRGPDGSPITGAGYKVKFPAGEPLFLLRGQDRVALASVEHYAVNCYVVGADPLHASAARGAADGFRAWQAAHPDRVKAPD